MTTEMTGIYLEKENWISSCALLQYEVQRKMRSQSKKVKYI